MATKNKNSNLQCILQLIYLPQSFINTKTENTLIEKKSVIPVFKEIVFYKLSFYRLSLGITFAKHL